MKTIEITVDGDHDPLRLDRAYTLTPVIEGDLLLGYEVWDADSGSFVMFVTDEQVKATEA